MMDEDVDESSIAVDNSDPMDIDDVEMGEDEPPDRGAGSDDDPETSSEDES